MADPNQPPVISSYDVQGSASTAGGEVVTVTGSNLSVVTSVAIGGFDAGFVIDSDTQLRFTAPAVNPNIRSDPATAKVWAFNNSMQSDTSQFPEWTWGGQTLAQLQPAQTASASSGTTVGNPNQPPVISSYDVQGSASTAGGEVVTVTGSNLSVVTSVAIGGFDAGFVIDADTQLRFTAPAYNPNIRSDPATAKVWAFNNSMQSDTSQFPEWTWGGQTLAELQPAQSAATAPVATLGNPNQPPVMTSYDVQGSASTGGGEMVTVTGSNLSVVTSVAIGGFDAGFVIDSDTQLRFTAPAYNPNIRSDPATAKVWAFNNSMQSETSQFSEWTWGGQTLAELQAAQTN